MANYFSETEDSFIIIPPQFEQKIHNYTSWKKQIALWQHVTDIPYSEQGNYLARSIDDETLESLLQCMTITDMMSADGANKILRRLDILFQSTPLVKSPVTKHDTVSSRTPIIEDSSKDEPYCENPPCESSSSEEQKLEDDPLSSIPPDTTENCFSTGILTAVAEDITDAEQEEASVSKHHSQNSQEIPSWKLVAKEESKTVEPTTSQELMSCRIEDCAIGKSDVPVTKARKQRDCHNIIASAYKQQVRKYPDLKKPGNRKPETRNSWKSRRKKIKTKETLSWWIGRRKGRFQCDWKSIKNEPIVQTSVLWKQRKKSILMHRDSIKLWNRKKKFRWKILKSSDVQTKRLWNRKKKFRWRIVKSSYETMDRRHVQVSCCICRYKGRVEKQKERVRYRCKIVKNEWKSRKKDSDIGAK